MTTKTKEGALKAARKALGETAVEGVDFNLRNTGAGWGFEPVPAANEAAKKARAKKEGYAKAPPTVKEVQEKNARTAEKRAARAAPSKTEAKSATDRDTKTRQFMDMLRAPGGATSKELEQAMGWKSHSVRGLIGTLKQRGENVVSKKIKGEPTYYQLLPKKVAPAPDVGDVI